MLDTPDTALPGLIGMVHVRALPGTPSHRESMRSIVRRAVEEATTLVKAGFESIIIENMHDVPYLRRHVGPEIVAGMTAVAVAVRQAVAVPLGVQVLAGASRAALAVALASDAQFIRVEGFVFASVADEGLMDEADAGPLLRYRRAIGADSIRVLADVKKKHSSHAITSDVNLEETVRAAEFFGADGVVVTGVATAQSVDLDELKLAKSATTRTVLVGSGVRPDSMKSMLQHSDGVIVGSYCKRDGAWQNELDPKRIDAIVRAYRAAAPRERL